MASSMLTAELSASGSTEAEVDKALKASLLACANDPDFAIICDFLQKFSKDLGLDLPNFKLLLQWLTKTDEVSPQLRDMQIKLLRKTRKTVHEKCWESALSKFCFTYSAQDGWEIERFGYKNSSVKVKLRILRELLECQFERNNKFRSKILTLSADSLRSKPIGRDRQGHAYWVTQDNDCNIRIYQEHLDDEIWHVVATNRDEFVNLLKRLKGSEVIEPCGNINIADEDTTSSSIGQFDSSSIQKDLRPQNKVDSPEDEQKIPKLSIKLALGRNSKERTNTKYIGKGEEELAAEEDAKLLRNSCSATVASCEDEFEEIEEECGEESGSDGDIEHEIIEGEKHVNGNGTDGKSRKNIKSKDINKKVEPLVISQNKIVNNDTVLISTDGGKKRTLDEKDCDLSAKSENQKEAKKCRPSLLHSKRSKFSDKIEEIAKASELKESSEEIDEEDIDSAAAEEDENEEKLFDDDENEDYEVGEEISDPVVKVMGEGSGRDCSVENNLYGINYDLENCVSPTSDNIIVEDVRYVYGEGNGEDCLVGNIKTEKDAPNEDSVLNQSITNTETKSLSEPEIEIPKNENKELEQIDNKISRTITPAADGKDKGDTEQCFRETDNRKAVVDKKAESSTETDGKEVVEQVNSVNDVHLENLSKNILTEDEVIKKDTTENTVLSNIETSVDVDVETACTGENENLTKSNSKSPTQISKMTALESLKKELRESKQKLLEKKLPQTVESSNLKTSSTSIYNRKRRFTDQAQIISARPSNSESEIELNSENNEDVTNVTEVGESEQDVGGKRLKMRPKQSSSEIRKKIEAQKVAVKEEATSSSSGEEGLKEQTKTVVLKKSSTSENMKTEKNFQNQRNTKDELAKNDLVEGVKSQCADLHKRVAHMKPGKVKPTLAEIIEKKLKKTLDKKGSESTSTDKRCNEEVSISKNKLPSLNQTPITKPLKKNVLIKIRQEANDEIPRKRCNSQDCNPTALTDTKSICSTTKDGEENSISLIADFDKQTNALEKQRKRRSSEETVYNDKPEEPEAKKEVTLVKEMSIVKHDNSRVAIKEEDKKHDFFLQTEKCSVSGRRSGRRSGVVPNYVDASLPKRNRGATKNSKKLNVKCEKIVSNEKTDLDKSKAVTTRPKSEDNKNDQVKSRNSPPTIAPNTNEAKQVKTESNTSLANSPKSITTPKSAAKGARKQREVDTTNIIDVDSETPVRQSRRIAQQKIKEEAERRKLEEIALRTMKQELKKKKKAEKEADPTIAPPTDPSSESDENDVERKKRSQKKKFPGKDGSWSSGSEEQEEPEEEDEEPPHYETDPGSPLFKSDHEFSPESDIEDEAQVVPMKRARTLRKEDADVDGITVNEEEEACQKCHKSDHPEWILLCDHCDKGYHCSCLSPVLFYIPEGNWYCPPCQQEQLIKSLEEQLKEFDDLMEKKKKMEENQKRIAEEEKARQEEEEKEEKNKCKIKKDKKKNTKIYNNNSSSEDHSEGGDEVESITNSDGSIKSESKSQSKQRYRSRISKNSDKRYQRDRRAISSRNRRNRFLNRGSDSESDSLQYSPKTNSVSRGGISSSSSTYSESDNEPIYKLRKRRQINVSYRLNEYDDLINSALKKEMDEVAGAGNLGRGKDISTIIEADKEEKARQKQIHEGEVFANEQNDNYVHEQQQGLSDTTLNDANKDEIQKKIKKDESDSDSDAEPIIRKLNVKPSQRKKSRKLTTLDISSEDDDASDEDFKGSSIDDEEEEEEDTSITASNSDSSLEIYKKHGKFKKKQRKAARRAFRERRRDRRFLVDESDDDDITRPKSKKKRKEESDYTESEGDDEDISDLSENIDSADLCDDTTTEESDGAWRPNRKKKAKKSTNATEIKHQKPKNSYTKKPKRVEYSDDDVSDSEEDEDEEVGGSGKGYGKQPRSQPLKKPSSSSTKTKGKGKEKPDAKVRNKKSSENESSQSNSEDSTRRTRGRRYAYIEDFDDDSSDGGIKPGVQRPDTPPEEREKFIKRQEEIKRMLAEKNAEGAILAATPRLTPIKTDGEKDKKSPAKTGGDSLSTVPLSVIRQAKVLDIDYLQRRGENLDELSNEVGEVGDDFDDADLPDDLPEDMDEDAIARMVEEEEEFVVAAARELPAPDEVLRTSNLAKQNKAKELEKPISTENSSLSEISQKVLSSSLPPPSSNLQEPIRKRLPMPTIHPPLLRHQYLMHESMTNTQHIIQRHGSPSSNLLQSALSAPLSQPLDRNYPSVSQSPHHPLNRNSIHLQSSVTHTLNTTRPSHSPSSSVITKQSTLLDRTPLEKSTNPQNVAENKPRGRRKKITPLRDTLQKQQAAAAVTAATATSSALCSSLLKNSEPSLSGVIKSGSTHKLQVPPNVMHPASHSPVCRPPVPLPPIGVPFVGADGSRFYDALGSRSQQSGIQRHRGPSPMPGSLLPPPHTNRSSYGPPPPLKGSNSASSPVSSPLSATGSIRNPIQHMPPQYLGMPPNARHASHLNMFRPAIYGNPNFGPRSSLRPPNILAQEFTSGSRAYPPYGYYPPPPPLTTPGLRPGPARTSTQIPPVQSNIPHLSTSVIVTSKTSTSSSVALKPASAPIPEITESTSKSVVVKEEFPIKSSSPKSTSPTLIGTQIENPDAIALPSTVPRKKLTTLQAYTSGTSKKSPVSDSSGSRSPPNPSIGINDDSSPVLTLENTTTAEESANKEDKASEFSGLVSYFSSQHDDYNT